MKRGSVRASKHKKQRSEEHSPTQPQQLNRLSSIDVQITPPSGAGRGTIVWRDHILNSQRQRWPWRSARRTTIVGWKRYKQRSDNDGFDHSGDGRLRSETFDSNVIFKKKLYFCMHRVKWPNVDVSRQQLTVLAFCFPECLFCFKRFVQKLNSFLFISKYNFLDLGTIFSLHSYYLNIKKMSLFANCLIL